MYKDLVVYLIEQIKCDVGEYMSTPCCLMMIDVILTCNSIVTYMQVDCCEAAENIFNIIE